MRKFSRDVVGDETNPYRIAQKLFAAVDRIPWAGAREYSTISNISDYALHAGHADCGQQTLLLMTLLRLNGIPARWQSGMGLLRRRLRQHARLGQLYLAPYGWVPMDVTFGRLAVRRPADRRGSISAGSTPTASHSTTTSARRSCRRSSTSAPTPSIHNAAKSNGAAATCTSTSGTTSSRRRCCRAIEDPTELKSLAGRRHEEQRNCLRRFTWPWGISLASALPMRAHSPPTRTDHWPGA